MSRSVWKGPFSPLKENKSSLFIERANDPQIVWSRASIILPENIGKQFKIHNGKGWILRSVIESMVGHKFGEFSVTKKRVIHKTNKRRQTSKKK